MGNHVLKGNPPIPVVLRRSTRARRISLRVSRLDGRVTLTLPQRLAEREALAFLQDREAWLRGHLAQVGEAHVVRDGSTVLFEGAHVPLRVGTVRRAALQNGVLDVPGTADTASVRVKAFLKMQARDRLASASDHYAVKLGVDYDRITLRDTRSRWGSCSSKGALMYSWRLIMAPPAILHYVAAHEVAHLIEMNHSAAFWAIVAKVDPNYRDHRKWLRENGNELHRIQFGD